MTFDIRQLWRHRPFQIAAIWEALCIVLALVLIFKGAVELLAIAAIWAGVLPMGVVMLLYFKGLQTAKAEPDRSKDLVQ